MPSLDFQEEKWLRLFAKDNEFFASALNFYQSRGFLTYKQFITLKYEIEKAEENGETIIAHENQQIKGFASKSPNHELKEPIDEYYERFKQSKRKFQLLQKKYYNQIEKESRIKKTPAKKETKKIPVKKKIKKNHVKREAKKLQLQNTQNKLKKDVDKEPKQIKKEESKSLSLVHMRLIDKMFKYKESIEFYENRLKNEIYDGEDIDLLAKAKFHFQAIKHGLESNSCYVCLDCKKIFSSKEKLNEHRNTKRTKLGIKCLYCDDEFASESGFRDHEKSHEIDLHGFSVEDAFYIVKEKLLVCWKNKIKGIKLIHGYHHGQSLRNFFHSNKFFNEMKKNGLNINVIKVSNPGETLVTFSKSKKT